MANLWKEREIGSDQIIKRRRGVDSDDTDVMTESSQESSNLNELAKLMTTLTRNVSIMGNSNGNSKVGSDVVPVFNPEDRNQDIIKWIRKVDELKSIYGWDEKTTIYCATSRLRGMANVWYQSLPTIDFNWETWKSKLQEAFPTEIAFDQQLEEMLARKKKKDENIIQYFYEKLALLNNCEIFGKKAVACIIGGIPDINIRTAAKVKDFEKPENLLIFLKATTMETQYNLPTRKPMPHRHSTSNNYNQKRKCYGCGSRNHILPQCPSRQRTKEIKYHQKELSMQQKGPKQVLAMEESGKIGDKYFKKVFINGMSVRAYIDFGSTCNVLKEEMLGKLRLQHDGRKKYIRGYGGSVVEALGNTEDVTLKIDNVEAKTSFLIVTNNFQNIPAIVGQPFTEQPHITIYKDANKLLILPRENLPYDLDEIPVKIKFYLENALIIPAKHTCNVICKSEKKGTFYLDTSVRMKENNEYILPRSIVKTDDNGRCVVPIINPTDNDILVRPNRIFARGNECKPIQSDIMVIKNGSVESPINKFECLKIGETLEKEEVDKLKMLLKTYENCFATSLNELGCTSAAELNIDLVDDKAVVYRPYRMNPANRERVKDIVQELLENGIIRESCSPFSSPVLLVKKKNGEHRLCIDYRMLNSKVKQDHFPLPRIDDQLDYLQGQRYFTSLDMTSGYYQIPVAESSKYKTAFVTPDGQFEFNRMPFGITTAPAVFQRMINKILGPLRGTIATAYLDDILIPSRNFTEGIERLEIILKIIQQNNLTLNPKKCHFFATSITYLGFEINSEGMKPGLEKTKCISNFSNPKNVHQVRQFLGLTGFFRQFIENYAIIARPLTELTKKDKKWIWEEQEEKAFQSLKHQLTNRPILSIYNPKAETEVHTDASKLGVAGILMQKDENGKMHPVAYYSRRTTKCEENYHSFELETLAVVESLKKFRVYLLDISFKVVTDCNSIKMAAKKKDLIPRIARWWLQLQEFTFTIEYRAGSKMRHVDALSRNPEEEIQENAIEEVLHIEKADWILANQLNDDKIKILTKILESTPSTEYEKRIHNEYKLEGGRLYKITSSGSKWVVPKGMRSEVVRTAHDEIGHFGIEKTLKKLTESYWFPKMQKYVERYIHSCIPCLYSKQPKGKLEGLLNPIEKIPIPFHTVHMDHLGPFIKSTTGKKYVIVCVDAFTKYVLLYATKDIKTLPVLHFLDQIITIFGVPKRIITDQGTCYTSKAFGKYCEKHAIQHVQNAVATPRANGQVERFNAIVLQALKATSEDDTKWDKQLPKIQFGINNTVHSVTGTTASKLLFGYTPISPGDAQLQALVSISDQNPSNREEEREKVEKRLKENQRKQKIRFDKQRKPGRNYNVGDLVLVKKNVASEGVSRKLVSKYKGPFRILKKLRHERYIVGELPGSFRSSRAAYRNIESVEHIKPWAPQIGKSDSEDESEIE